MTIYIAHRGNVDGQNANKENSPIYVDLAIRRGFSVEVDLWIEAGEPLLGHDEGTYEITKRWLFDRSEWLWVHCKNLDALRYMKILEARKEFNYFWHQEDDYAITNRGFFWAYPGSSLSNGNNMICVMPEKANYSLQEIESCYAVCSDEVLKICKGEWE